MMAVSGFFSIQRHAWGAVPVPIDVETPVVEVLDGLEDDVSDLAWSLDGRRLAVAHGPSVSLVDARALRAVARLDAPRSPQIDAQAVAFSPDGSALAIAYVDGSMDLWDAIALTRVRAFESPGGYVTGALRFTHDGVAIAAILDIKAVRVWEVASGRILWTAPVFVADTLLAALSPDLRTVFAEEPPGSVQRWSVHANRPLWTRDAHGQRVDTVALSPDGKIGATDAWDREILLWDVERGVPLRPLLGHESSVHALAFSGDGAMVASAAWDDTIRVWDVASGGHVVTLRGCAERRTRFAWSPDGSRLAAGSRASLCVWEIPSGTRAGALEPHVTPVGRVDFGPDGRTMALSLPRSRSIAILDLEQGTVSTIPTACPRCGWGGEQAIASSGHILATSYGDGSVVLFDLRNGSIAAVVRATEDGGAYAFTGHEIELFGSAARRHAACRVGARLYPLELCEARLVAPGLLRRLL